MSTKPLKVAIFGTGPAAMVVAQAAVLKGCKVHFMSNSLKKSDLHGCQFLHKPIYGMPVELTETTRVTYDLVGDVSGYRRKVYGDGYRGSVSVESMLGERPAYDLRATYIRLWKLHLTYGHFTPLTVTPDRLSEIHGNLFSDFDLAVSTVPAIAMCKHPDLHNFDVQEIYASGDAPKLGLYAPIVVADDTVVCNGNPEPSWYRASRIFGHSTVEWPGGRKPPFEGVRLVKKPIGTNCDCFPRIQRLGRYGSWRKSVLVNDVFDQAMLYFGIALGHTIVSKRRDICFRCGGVAVRESASLHAAVDGIEYRCLMGHVWKGKDDGPES
jgi:hypothetical protein